MNTEQFYEKIGGNYADTMSRLMTEERVLKFVRKFPADGSFSLLKDALARGAQEEAFRAAHTLKGVAQNLGFTTLYEKASAVTEVLRGGSLDVAALMPGLESVYNLTVESISALD
ncbi:MAG: Hpt domain-containing protein [Clostridia bacterium]|nr:Hpt domain-containing protein [Clostridia bacterium]